MHLLLRSPVATYPFLLPNSPNKTAARRNAGIASGQGSLSGEGTCEARLRRASRDSSVSGSRCTSGGSGRRRRGRVVLIVGGGVNVRGGGMLGM